MQSNLQKDPQADKSCRATGSHQEPRNLWSHTRTGWSIGSHGGGAKTAPDATRAQELQNNWEPVGHQCCRGSHQELWNPWSHQGPAGALGATRRTSGATKLREPGGIPVVLQNHTREPQSSMGCTVPSCHRSVNGATKHREPANSSEEWRTGCLVPPREPPESCWSHVTAPVEPWEPQVTPGEPRWSRSQWTH